MALDPELFSSQKLLNIGNPIRWNGNQASVIYIMKVNQAIMIVNKTAISKELPYRKGALVVSLM